MSDDKETATAPPETGEPKAPPDHAPKAHPAGSPAATTPVVPSPPMTPPGPDKAPQVVPAPRSNAATGVVDPAPPRPAGVATAEPSVDGKKANPPAAASPTETKSPVEKAPTAPAPAAARPAPAAKPAAEDGVSRRSFMKWSVPVGWVAFSGACASSLIATARFMFPNVLFEPPQSFKAGFPSEYNVGEVDIRWKDAYGVWIVREPAGFYALIAVCTHLGCSPNWLTAENKFKCPCHGSGFYKTGINFEGPAPRPLERARIVLADDGQILVDKSVKFQFEKGEWDKSEAFLKA